MRPVVLLACFLPGMALAQPEQAWEPIDFETDEAVTFAIERATMQRTGSTVTLRTRMQRQQPSPTGLYRTTGRWRYDCAARTAALLEYEVFGIGGETLETFVADAPETERVQPDTAHDFIMRAICRA